MRARGRPIKAFFAACAVLAFGIAVACSGPSARPTADPELAALFTQLRASDNATDAGIIENQIWARWTTSGSETIDVLMERASAAEAAGDRGLAREFLVQTTELAPQFAEAWYRRAALAYEQQDYAGAIRGIEETLKREPNHFAAFADLGVIYEEMGQDRAALAAYRAALAIHPFLTSALQGEQRLSARLNGEEA